MTKAKPYAISKQVVWDAYKKVKANRGAAGVDGESLAAFEKDLKNNLYKIWNRMSSGSYFPPPVLRVDIPKGNSGSTRPLGIPTVSDRIAQMVVKLYFEPLVEPHFHPDSYGYRPGKSALDAVGVTRQRCWRQDGVIDLDIKGFFDNLDWNLVLRAVRHHTDIPWVLLYVERWLKAPVQRKDGSLEERTKGSPQGSVISPLLANLFMHYAFDEWLRVHVRFWEGLGVRFPRATRLVVGFRDQRDAQRVMEVLPKRFGKYGLTIHPDKTRLVPFRAPSPTATGYDRPPNERPGTFDFLGFTHFWARSRRGQWIVKRKTASDRFSRAVRSIDAWCRGNRHQPIGVQQQKLNQKIRGHCAYYGITGNGRALARFYCCVTRSWCKWLNRRNRQRSMTWEVFVRLLERYPLVHVRTVHSVYNRAAKL